MCNHRNACRQALDRRDATNRHHATRNALGWPSLSPTPTTLGDALRQGPLVRGAAIDAVSARRRRTRRGGPRRRHGGKMAGCLGLTPASRLVGSGVRMRTPCTPMPDMLEPGAPGAAADGVPAARTDIPVVAAVGVGACTLISLRRRRTSSGRLALTVSSAPIWPSRIVVAQQLVFERDHAGIACQSA